MRKRSIPGHRSGISLGREEFAVMNYSKLTFLVVSTLIYLGIQSPAYSGPIEFDFNEPGIKYDVVNSTMKNVETAPCSNLAYDPYGINLGNPCNLLSNTQIDAEFVGGKLWETAVTSNQKCITISAPTIWDLKNQVLICEKIKVISNPRLGNCYTNTANECLCDSSNPEYTIKWMSKDSSCAYNVPTLKQKLKNAVNFLSFCTARALAGTPCVNEIE